MILLAAIAACVAAGHAAASRILGATRDPLDRLSAGALLALAQPIAIVEVLGRVHHLAPTPIAVATFASALLVVATMRARRLADDVRALRAAVAGALVGGTWALAAWCGLFAMALGVLAAYLLPPWAWDALGYHLPIVHDALATGALREIPTHVVYVQAYPRLVDLYFVWWRALLRDDTWIDLAQLPFAIAGVLAIAAMGRRGGASPARAVAFALAWLAIPAVALQLPTNYVDVAFAALLVQAALFGADARDGRDLAFAAVALGLFLGSKPSAPLPFAIVALATLTRAFRFGAWRPLAAIGGALVIGGGSYVANLRAHGNPIWPVDVRVAGVHLPGLESAKYYFDLGVPEPWLHRGWLARLLGSWFMTPDHWIYDMRFGGYGPAVGFALVPLSLLVLARGRTISRAALVLAVAGLASPAAFWARYTLAFPAALLAIVAGDRRRASHGGLLELALGAFTALGLVFATPGFTDGVGLVHLARTTAARRPIAFGGIDGHEAEWERARSLVGDGDAFAYDESFGLPGQLRRSDGRGAAVYVGGRSGEAVLAALVGAHARVAVLSPRHGAEIMRARDGVLTELFACPLDACTVFRVDPP